MRANKFHHPCLYSPISCFQKRSESVYDTESDLMEKWQESCWRDKTKLRFTFLTFAHFQKKGQTSKYKPKGLIWMKFPSGGLRGIKLCCHQYCTCYSPENQSSGRRMTLKLIKVALNLKLWCEKELLLWAWASSSVLSLDSLGCTKNKL